jgi:hypothetical protein
LGGRSSPSGQRGTWSDYRIEAEEVENLGEESVIVVGRQRGTGKLSGAEVDYPIFIVWKFRENEVIGVYLPAPCESIARWSWECICR